MNSVFTHILVIFFLIRIFNPISYIYWYFYPKQFNISCGKMTLNFCKYFGPGFIKLIQSLNYRNDILPQEFLNETSCLLDSVQPDGELENKIYKMFDDVQILSLLGSGTIGQVYSCLLDNKKVAIKVKRNFIEKKIEEDLNLLQKWINFIDYCYPYYSLRLKTRQIFYAVKMQSDFKKEAKNQLLFHKTCKKLKYVQIPEVYEKYCSDDIIVMEFVDADTLIKDAVVINNTLQKKTLDDLTLFLFDTLMSHDIAHGDLHAGNILIDKTSKIWIIDFGLIYEIDEEKQLIFYDYIRYFLKRDSKKMFVHILKNYIVNPNSLFEKDLLILLENVFSNKNVKIWNLSLKFMEISKKHNIILSENFIQLEIAVTNIVGLTLLLYNDDTLLEECLKDNVDIFI